MHKTPRPPVEVFISYSREDENLKDELLKHLRSLQLRGVITGWHDRELTGGEEWEGAINEHLKTARIILLLVSTDFIVSDYCSDVEVNRAMERHKSGEAVVIPIILRPCDWRDTPFGKLQALPKDALPVTSWEDKDKAFLNIEVGIKKAVARLNPPPPTIDYPEKTSRNSKVIFAAISVAVVLLVVASWITFYRPANSAGPREEAERVINADARQAVKEEARPTPTPIQTFTSTSLRMKIRINLFPPYDPAGGRNSKAPIGGEVSGITPQNYRDYNVVIYSKTNTWYVQPTIDKPLTVIQPDGKWSAEIQTGAKYAALLIPHDYKPPDTTDSQPSRLGGVLAAAELEWEK